MPLGRSTLWETWPLGVELIQLCKRSKVYNIKLRIQVVVGITGADHSRETFNRTRRFDP